MAETVEGAFGSLTITPDGAWTYTLDPDFSITGDITSVDDTITVQSVDGTTQSITVTINDAGDAPADLSISLVGTDGDDVLIGGGGDDTLIGLEGRDTLIGSDGDDTLDGGLGQDLLNGGAGNDVLIGDILRGSNSPPSIDFNSADDRDATGPITVMLSSESSVTGDVSVGTDTLIGIERCAWR